MSVDDDRDWAWVRRVQWLIVLVVTSAWALSLVADAVFRDRYEPPTSIGPLMMGVVGARRAAHPEPEAQR